MILSSLCSCVCDCLEQAKAGRVNQKSFVASCHVQATSQHPWCSRHGPLLNQRGDPVDESGRASQRRQSRLMGWTSCIARLYSAHPHKVSCSPIIVSHFLQHIWILGLFCLHVHSGKNKVVHFSSDRLHHLTLAYLTCKCEISDLNCRWVCLTSELCWRTSCGQAMTCFIEYINSSTCAVCFGFTSLAPEGKK